MKSNHSRLLLTSGAVRLFSAPFFNNSFQLHIMKTTFACSLILAILTLSSVVSAQNCVDLGGVNSTLHSQNFDALGDSPAPQATDAGNIIVLNASGPRRYLGKFDNAVADDAGVVNLPGFALVEEGSSVSAVSGRYGVSDGSLAGGNTYSFASVTDPLDRAFGSINDDTININYLGGCFRNTSGSPVSSVRIAFTGELWRLGGSGTPDQLDFQYAVNATNLHAGTYLDFNALDFATPNLVGGAGPRDGNAAANRTVVPVTVIPVTLAANETIHVRWRDSNIVGAADDGLAIDDFSIRILGTTAASASLSGRVTTAGGRGIRGVQVSLQGANGTFRTAQTTSFGYYQFEDVQVGETYSVTVSAKRFQFNPSSRTVSLSDQIADLDFVSAN